VGTICFNADFAPQQIRTFRIDGDQVSETNLIEA